MKSKLRYPTGLLTVGMMAFGLAYANNWDQPPVIEMADHGATTQQRMQTMDIQATYAVNALADVYRHMPDTELVRGDAEVK